MAMPIWLKDKMFLKKLIKDELKKVEVYDKKKLKLLFPEHHLSHTASAFYPSPFTESAILTIDGVGEWATASICHGNKNEIKIIKELRFPNSLGLLYSAFTYYLGFKVNSGEYKLMGLAPYGDAESDDVKKYVELIKTKLIDIKNDGSIGLDQKYFNYAVGLTMANDKEWEKLFGFAKRESESELQQFHCNLGLAIQIVTEEVVIKMANEAAKLTQSKNLCLAGGVALNCVANGKLQNLNIFENIFIQPASGDAGGAPGAALAAHYIYFKNQRNTAGPNDEMNGAYLGPEFSDIEIIQTAKKYKANYQFFENEDALCNQVASLIANENVIGWFQGKMEFGPRALGNRSILGDPRSEEMQKKINLKIKYRESFRPFAPAVLAEDAQNYFDLKSSSPYMLLVQPVKNNLRKQLPKNYNALPLKEKLYYKRSELPSITHIDFSARIQTVHKETNPKFHKLIMAFKKITGTAMLINTSFNVRGEPIVCSPTDAYKCLMRTEMDYLVIGNFLFEKTKQPEWKEKDNWQTEYQLD